MEPNPQHGRCTTCGTTITAVGRMMTLTAKTVLERYPTAPPRGIPDDALDVTWIAEPCYHEMTLIELREAGIEVDRYEHPDVAGG